MKCKDCCECLNEKKRVSFSMKRRIIILKSNDKIRETRKSQIEFLPFYIRNCILRIGMKYNIYTNPDYLQAVKTLETTLVDGSKVKITNPFDIKMINDILDFYNEV